MKKLNNSIDPSKLTVPIHLAWDVVSEIFELFFKQQAEAIHLDVNEISITTSKLKNLQPSRAVEMIRSALNNNYETTLQPDHIHIEYIVNSVSYA